MRNSSAVAEPINPQILDMSSSDFSPEEIQRFNEWYEQNQHKILAPDKYFKAQKSFLKEQVEALLREKPDLTAKELVVSILQMLPSFLPADNLVEVTSFILQQWKKLSQPATSRLKKNLKPEFAEAF